MLFHFIKNLKKEMCMKMKQMCMLAMAALFLAGCTHTKAPQRMISLQQELSQKQAQIEELQKASDQKDAYLSEYKEQLMQKDQALAEMHEQKTSDMSMQTPMTPPEEVLLPPKAKVGECYARVFVPPTYTTEQEQVLKKGESETLAVIPAKYGEKEEQVLVKEASEMLTTIPAQYTWKADEVMVSEASTRLVTVPAVYEWQEEKILLKAAHQEWKKGRGPTEKIDNTTGEIMCLVEVPAVYKTVRKQIMTTPPTTKEVMIPAQYKTVKKRVLIAEPRIERVTIPAEYKTVKVKTLLEPARTIVKKIPAEYATVTRTVKTTEGHLEWKRILCETNTTPDVIKKIQNALRTKGYDPGPLDNAYGPLTKKAMVKYQQDNKLATGAITFETLESLGLIR